MTGHLEFYRCEICGNIVQVMHSGEGELVCCGKPMIKLEPKGLEQEMKEKHVPVFIGHKIIQVGSEIHPMNEEHHIEFIQALTEDKKCVVTKFLNINEEPKMNFEEDKKFNCAIEYCNLHGLWKGMREN